MTPTPPPTDAPVPPDHPDHLENLEHLVAALDLETKVRLLTGEAAFTLWGEESVGLAPMAFSDGPTGVRGLKFTGGEKVALLPNATVLASAWSEDNLREVGAILAAEAQRQHIHVVLGPTINLHRTALGGRLFEQFSEDPLLTARCTTAYVQGMQAEGVGACPKHWVANESETLRNYVNSVVDEATLRELYLLPFEITVRDAHPWVVMAAYNKVGGVEATEHEELNNAVLKGEWGWDGVLVSDWYATKSAGPAALGGLDLVMPGPEGPWGAALVADVESGAVAESVIDDKVVRLLRLATRVGALGEARAQPDVAGPTSVERRAQVRRLATDGLVVLKNDAATLPLEGSGRVAVIGRSAVETAGMGGGSAHVNAPYVVSLAEGLAEHLGDRVVTVDGVPIRRRPVAVTPQDARHPVTGEPGVRLVTDDSDGVAMADERLEVGHVTVAFDDDLPRDPARLAFSAIAVHGGRSVVGAIGTGDWSLRVDGAEVGSSQVRVTGVDPGEGMLVPPFWTTEVDLPAGALIEAVCRIVTDDPVPGPDGTVGIANRLIAAGLGVKSFVLAPAEPPADATLAAAVDAARGAEVAVVAVGLTDETEAEGQDKTSLALPGEQDALVRAVAAVAPRTVVVVNAATPVLMPWAGEVDAILVAGLPGQEAGHAIADALLGVREPAGRLVTTWPAADGAAPAWEVEPDGLDLTYDEGTFVGHRGWYAGRAPAPAHWFGEGLGYGSWDYLSARVATGMADSRDGDDGDGADVGDESPTVEVTIRNISARTSREVVQVYLQPAEPEQPVRLVGWAAATVEPGAEQVVTVATEPRMWRRWDAAAHAWARLAAGGELLVARGLGDIRARVSLSAGGPGV